jgi:hypothetical protein
LAQSKPKMRAKTLRSMEHLAMRDFKPRGAQTVPQGDNLSLAESEPVEF